jgi:hypothetical protein
MTKLELDGIYKYANDAQKHMTQNNYGLASQILIELKDALWAYEKRRVEEPTK